MFRVSGHRSGDTFDIWLFEDNGFLNDSSQWTDLLEGATTVTVEAATVTRHPVTGAITSQGPWLSFTVTLAKFSGASKRNLRSNLGPVPKDQEYFLRFSIDGGAFSTPITFRWTV